ncbi:MAG: hypothetical protein RL186_1815 [Pseudomonadota bacterium]
MPNNGAPNGFDTKLVKDLAKILRDIDLSEIEVENEGVRVRVARHAGGGAVVQYAAPARAQQSEKFTANALAG